MHSIKWKGMKRRIGSLLLAVALAASEVPMAAYAQEPDQSSLIEEIGSEDGSDVVEETEEAGMLEEASDVEEIVLTGELLANESGWIEVSTYDELKAALEADGDHNVRVASDIVLRDDRINDYYISLGSGNYVLDIYGHKIVRHTIYTIDRYLIEIPSGAKLSVINTSPNDSYFDSYFAETTPATFYVCEGAELSVGDLSDNGKINITCAGESLSASIWSAGKTYIYPNVVSGSDGVIDYGAVIGKHITIFGGEFHESGKGAILSQGDCIIYQATLKSDKGVSFLISEEYGNPVSLAPGSKIYVDGQEKKLEEIGYHHGLNVQFAEVKNSYMTSSKTLGYNLTWDLDVITGELRISGNGAMPDFDDKLVNIRKAAPWHAYKEIIKSVVIEDGITYIGNYAFDECSNITNFEVPWSVKSLGTNVCDCDLGMNSFFRVKYYGSEMQWKRMVEATASNNELKDYDYFNFRSYGGKTGENVYWNLNNDDNILIIYGSGPMYDDYDSSLHFIDFNSVKTAYIDYGVTTIGKGAFCHGGKVSLVESVYIPASVTEIKEDAFYYCENLHDVTFGVNSQLKSIGEYAFSNTNLTNIVLPEGLETIGDAAFYESNLKEVTIPTTVTSIGAGAFTDTDLTKVIYNGTQEQWEQINIDSNNPDLFALIEGFVRPHDHTGGTATCTSKAVCEICGVEYGDFDPEDHDFCVDGICDSSKARCSICRRININYYDFDSLVAADDKTYTGSAITSNVTMAGIPAGPNYTVENVTKTEPGAYAVKIKGIGIFAGERIVYWHILPANGLWIANIPDQTYSGKVIKPEIDVYCDGVRLEEGKDFAVSYGKYNTNVAAKDAMKNGKSIAPSVTITGKGNYSEKKTMTFAIMPKSVNTATVDDIVVAKSNSAIKVNPTVKLNDKKLKAGTDYVVSTTTDASGVITSLQTPGEYNLYVVGKNNYTGYAPFKFTITEKILASKVSIDKIGAQEYDAENPVKPAVKVTYKKEDKTADFDITYKNNREVGTATVIITAKAGTNFAGTKTATFKITGTPISGAKLGEDGKGTLPSYYYDGIPYEPSLNLYVGTTRLIKDKDYTVTYANNCNVGTATATVVGKGKYTGSKKFIFKINKYDATADSWTRIIVDGSAAGAVNISVPYEKGGVTPKPIVHFGSILLKEKEDYTLSYVNNKAVATKDAKDAKGKDIAPTMIITFKGNLSGKQMIKFTIKSQKLDNCTMTVADKVVSTKANAWKQTAIAIVDSNGKKLVAGTDYSKSIEYYSDPSCSESTKIEESVLPAGATVYVKVVGINNYESSEVIGRYRISKYSIASAKATIDAKTFTGSEIKPAAADIKVTVGSGKNAKQLVAGTDYEIVPGTYVNNINSGKASVTIRGINDHCGTKVVTYQIGPKKFLWWEL